ncbi:MAG: hypothetical protein AB1758_05630 [Candidatus Eremiobacterota bacterium]
MRSYLGKALAVAKDRTPLWFAWGGRLWFLAGLFAVLMLTPLALGVCGCTLFTLASLLVVGACVGLVGNSAFGALTIEREKKTLDSLRLTQLTAGQIVAGKLVPEFLLLTRLLLVTAPTLSALALFGGMGLLPLLKVLALAACGGVLAGALAIAVSSLFDTTSRAVVAGWTVKGIWLLVTPVLDMVLGAVMVQENAVPVFAFVNPLNVLAVALVPEAARGVSSWLPLLGPLAMLAASLACGWLAARRFDAGLTAAPSLTDRVTHPVYRRGWGPGWMHRMFPGLRSNPFFLREMALQLRSGAARWPGYAVFLVLFMAPFFYARSWAVKDALRGMDPGSAPRITVSSELGNPRVIEPATPGQTEVAMPTRHVMMETASGTTLMLKGHTDCACLRLYLYGTFQVPLPRDAVWKVTYRPENHWGQQTRVVPTNVEPLDEESAEQMGLTTPTFSARNEGLSLSEEERLNRNAMSVGLAGTVVLLLLYLAIRCSGFMATAVTGERDRKTWEDLALTGSSPARALSGKLAGALLIMFVQMAVAFPILLFFAFTGSLSLAEVGALFVYATGVMVTSALVGLWASASSRSSHEAHARALLLVGGSFALAPLLGFGLGGVLAALALMSALVCLGVQRRAEALALSGVSFSLLLAPKVASPLSAVMAFMPSLSLSRAPLLRMVPAQEVTGPEAVVYGLAALVFLISISGLMWSLTMRRLGERAQNVALRADLSDAAA